MFSDSFWVEILLLKYEYQLPLQRVVALLAGHGLHDVASGTLCGGIGRAAQMLMPLYDAVVERDKTALLRHMDETGLKVFVEVEGRRSRLWCLWQSSTVDTCVFLLSHGHSAEVPETYLEDSSQEGVVCVDRHKAYANLPQTLSYCWAHVRRDFVKLARCERRSLGWAVGWIKRIKRLYRLNRERVTAKDNPEQSADAQAALDGAAAEFRRQWQEELDRPYNWLTVNRRKVLESIQRHWDGLTVFLRDPDIPMDNNAAERLFRPVANFRKAEISRRVCRKLQWLRPDGRLKDMSCRVALLRMHRDGLIRLPPPLKGNANGRRGRKITPRSDPGPPVLEGAGDLPDLRLRRVESGDDSSLWNEYVHRYHYLGYQPLPGAQLRYLVVSADRVLGLLGFGAAAWKTAPRDRWIGWDAEQRKRNLHLVVNNARFLILPWVESRNLASKLLAMAARRLADDWERAYSYRPVLLETFVQKDRFAGTCYKAASWTYLGDTKGRGKLDTKHRNALPVKAVFVYPLHPHFRNGLLR